MRVKSWRARRVQVRVAPLVPGRRGREREQVGEHGAHRVVERHRAIRAAHADVDVDAERVVAPGDVAQRALDDAVVRRVDDLLLPPRRPRVRAAGRERDADRVGLVEQRAPALDQRARGLGERLAAAGLDLDLRGDQLAGRVLAERRRVGARLELREAVDEAVRLGSTIWNSSSIARVRSCDGRRSRAPRRAQQKGQGCSGPSPRGYQRNRIYSRDRESADTARVERSRRVVLPPPGDRRRVRLVRRPVGRADRRLRRARDRLDGRRVDARARRSRCARRSRGAPT